MKRYGKSKALFCLTTFIIMLLWGGLGLGLAADTYKIGVLQPFSGPFALFGEEVFNACQIAAQRINASGGLLGRQVELIKQDSKTDPVAAVQAAKNLILVKKIDALICGSASHELLATLEITREHKIIHLTSVSNAEKATVENIHPYFFQTTPNTYMESVAVGRALAKYDFNSYMTIALDYEWGHSNVTAIDKIIKERKPTAKKIGELWSPLKESNYSSYITAILNKKPDLVVGILAGNPLLTFIRQANGYNFFNKVKFASPGYELELMTLGKEFPEGMRVYSRGPFYALKGAEMESFQKAYLKETKKYPTCWAIMSYDTVNILADAVKRAGSFNKDAIAKALEAGKYKTLRGNLEFRDIDHQMNAPIYFATTVFDKEKGFSIGKDVTVVNGEECWKSIDEIKKIRSEKGIVFTPWSGK
jgi:branched-chain amino acid transport system substrate-binding protein